MDINIDYFDPSKMEDDVVCLLIGKRGTGKSVLAQALMMYKTHFRRGVCVAKTEEGNHFWEQYIPKMFIHYTYSPKITRSVLEMQKKTTRRLPNGDPEPLFVIFDDCLSDPAFAKDPTTAELFMNGRHFNIFVLITAQFVFSIPPSLRTNVDYVFCLRDNIFKNRQRLYDAFFGNFENFRIFDRTFKECTVNNECIVLNNKIHSYDPSDNVFFYKATPNLKYKLCDPIYWAKQVVMDTQGVGEDTDEGAINEYYGDSKKKKRAEELTIKKRYPEDRTYKEILQNTWGKEY
jgi:hypothetical protein